MLLFYCLHSFCVCILPIYPSLSDYFLLYSNHCTWKSCRNKWNGRSYFSQKIYETLIIPGNYFFSVSGLKLGGNKHMNWSSCSSPFVLICSLPEEKGWKALLVRVFTLAGTKWTRKKVNQRVCGVKSPQDSGKALVLYLSGKVGLWKVLSSAKIWLWSQWLTFTTVILKTDNREQEQKQGNQIAIAPGLEVTVAPTMVWQ